MIITRRQALVLPAASLLSAYASKAVAATDGVGPNRGIAIKPWRGKQTCENGLVPMSDIKSRIAMPQDFNSNSCKMIADSHEGPFFTCAPAPGKDITYGESGQKLTIALRLVDGNCQPIPNGVVDIWACNATGHYSGYGYDPDASPPMVRAILFGHIEPDREQRFCRGALMTDADGIAEFDTIYPGFYYGQPIHVHFKAHVAGKSLLTSQANFSENWNEKVMKTAPYSADRPISRNTKESGFPIMKLEQRNDRLLATLDLVVPN